MKQKKIPARLQGILQSVDIGKLDTERDKSYIIHRILALGTLEDIQWLKNVYPENVIRNIFIKKPSKEYDKARFQFLARFVLSINPKSVPTNAYVVNTPRSIK